MRPFSRPSKSAVLTAGQDRHRLAVVARRPRDGEAFHFYWIFRLIAEEAEGEERFL
jgi:hypothetical protein